MRILALYLPQFHNIPENDEWWGDGFTEWTNVKKAQPLYDGHKQPRIPLNENYYNLLDDNVKIWQANLAKEYGIYGFCYYHYWFNGKLLLQKPMEQMLANPKIDIPFCINWANEPWTKAWVGEEKSVLIEQKYGNEKEWREHFDYLLPFFEDDRYIKVDNKPLFVIYRPEVVSKLEEMILSWDHWAKEAGFSGICMMSQSIDYPIDEGNPLFDYWIQFQPCLARRNISTKRLRNVKKIRRDIAHFIERHLGIDILRYGANAAAKAMGTNRLSYEGVWDNIVSSGPMNDKTVAGAFVSWDNSPRHGDNSIIYTGASPEIFSKYMSLQMQNIMSNYSTDFMVIYAWNEWAEGGYLEPDTDNEFGYLEGIKKALIENHCWPVDYSTNIITDSK